MKRFRVVVALAWAGVLTGCEKKKSKHGGALLSEDGFKGNFQDLDRPKERKTVRWEAPMQPPPDVRPPRVPPPPPKPQQPPGGPPLKKRKTPMDPAAKVAVPESPQPKEPENAQQAKSSPKDESSQNWEDPDKADDVDPGRAAGGSRYLSPARPKDLKVKGEAAAGTAPGQAAALQSHGAPAGSPAPELAGASVSSMKADIPAMLTDFSEEDGSYRVQISDSEEFKAILFDKTYPFLEDFDPKVELRRALSKGGNYYVRSAFIDLLEFQHPFSKPKHYYVRHRDLWGP